jgi:hypothetical protein
MSQTPATHEDSPPRREYHAPELRDLGGFAEMTHNDPSNDPYLDDGQGPYNS